MTRAYKQEDGVIYHARDMAVVRARIEERRRHSRLGDAVARNPRQRASRPLCAPRARRRVSRAAPCLRSRRLTCAAPRPRGGHGFRPRLVAALTETLARGEQALLFLNRRGYAPLDALPRLRPPLPMPELHRLARRASLPQARSSAIIAAMSNAGRTLPGLRRRRIADGRLRPRHRAAGGRSRRALARRAHLMLSSDLPGGAERLRASSMPSRAATAISSSARSSSRRGIISRCSRSSA